MNLVLLKKNLKSRPEGCGKNPNHIIIIPTIYRQGTGNSYGTTFNCYMNPETQELIYRPVLVVIEKK